MSEFEYTLRRGLPRPSTDPGFQHQLLGRLLSDRVIALPSLPEHPDEPEHRLLTVVTCVGGAVLGAAAIAVSAALGFRKGQRSRRAA